MRQIPYHITMIAKMDEKERSDEENQMMHDYTLGLGDYAEGSKFGQVVEDKQKQLPWSGSATSVGWQGGSTQTAAKWNTVHKRCYEEHPGLPIKLKGGSERFIYGGSCSSPIHDDADIYVGLDYTMKQHKQRLPWEPGHMIHYQIQDMGIPKDLGEFKKLIHWLGTQIINNKKVHIGCIGGHGRTGTVLAALVAHITSEPDPIAYVREHYCKKAVESKAQIDMLVKEWGCKPASGTKQYTKPVTSSGKVNKADTVNPIKAKHCLWPDFNID